MYAFAGRIPLPPRYAFGAWWSRYWAYVIRLRDLVTGFHQLVFRSMSS